MKRVLVTGAGGFLGSHLVKRLRAYGHYVIGISRRDPQFEMTCASEFQKMDLLRLTTIEPAFHNVDEIYQCAGETGGLGFLENRDADALILRNNLQINLNVLETARRQNVKRVLFVSTGCVYPASAPVTVRETDSYPAMPMNEFGWASLIVERLYAAYGRCHGLETRVARIHSTYGPHTVWRGGKERVPAALCRKVAEAKDGDSIEVWGDGTQIRSFMYVDDAVEGLIRLMASEFNGPINIGSTEIVSIDELARHIIAISGKRLEIKHVKGPVGAAGRCSDNTIARSCLGWEPSIFLYTGLPRLYSWVAEQVRLTARVAPG